MSWKTLGLRRVSERTKKKTAICTQCFIPVKSVGLTGWSSFLPRLISASGVALGGQRLLAVV